VVPAVSLTLLLSIPGGASQPVWAALAAFAVAVASLVLLATVLLGMPVPRWLLPVRGRWRAAFLAVVYAGAVAGCHFASGSVAGQWGGRWVLYAVLSLMASWMVILTVLVMWLLCGSVARSARTLTSRRVGRW